MGVGVTLGGLTGTRGAILTVAFVDVHSHAGERLPHERSSHSHEHGFRWRTLIVGLVHGIAGSAALRVLVVSQVGDQRLGMLYILVFGVGSMLGVGALSGAIAVPLALSARLLTWANRGLQASRRSTKRCSRPRHSTSAPRRVCRLGVASPPSRRPALGGNFVPQPGSQIGVECHRFTVASIQPVRSDCSFGLRSHGGTSHVRGT